MGNKELWTWDQSPRNREQEAWLARQNFRLTEEALCEEVKDQVKVVPRATTKQSPKLSEQELQAIAQENATCWQRQKNGSLCNAQWKNHTDPYRKGGNCHWCRKFEKQRLELAGGNGCMAPGPTAYQSEAITTVRPKAPSSVNQATGQNGSRFGNWPRW